MRSATTMLPDAAWQPLLEAAIAEDLGTGDVTSEITFGASDRAAGYIEARQELVVCGLALAQAVFHRV
ncbi:nicotinate-nucleotide diphosphorylase (carboxylating), partial [Pseudomonas sp. FW306-2-2C-B10A]